MCMLVSFSISFLFETVLDTTQKETAIDNLLRCLIEDIKEEKKSKKILSLAALDTLKQVTGEDNLGLRIQINFDEVLQRFAEYITTLKTIEFFEYVVDFIKMFYSHFTVDNLQFTLVALVSRITAEHQATMKKSKKTLDLRKSSKKTGKTKATKNSEIIVNKCWSVIRMFAEHQYFSGDMIPVIESAATPLLMLIS